ncbi:MAG: putative ATP-dependent helicase [Candidatus Tokpelaia sp. JSC189]|nr:MAG: putative ATP-dependent helicase [Candidatus Tokpelaia sp. JSC189]
MRWCKPWQQARPLSLSIANYSAELYRLAGYSIFRRWAVRIDTLERLADLIRSILKWQPSSAPRPEGVYDGRHFIITPAMMSIHGTKAEDMEEILKISVTGLRQVMRSQSQLIYRK